MRCNPWRWLWGLLLIAPLSWIALHLHQTEIENDLRARSKEALEAAGLSWATTTFDGRDALLTGRASEENDPSKASDLIRRVWGVRVVDARTDLISKVETFVWSATRSDGKRVKLSGFVPTEASRRAVLNAAKANLPGYRIDDAMELARGSPDRDVFIGGVGFALKQLAALKEGNVELAGTTLSIAGQTPDQTSLKTIRSRLKTALPQGIVLGRDAMTGPVIANYAWDAALMGNQVVMSGYVPSASVRDALFQKAKSLFPRHAVVDRVEVGEGAPEGFASAAAASLEQLNQLKDGRATLAGKAFTLKGRAQDQARANAVERSFAAAIPAPLSATSAITYPPPPPPPAPAAPEPAPAPPAPVAAAPAPAPVIAPGPYITTASIADGELELTGSVPSEDARIAVAAAVRERFPDVSIKDSLDVRSGAAEGWQGCLLAGLRGLGQLTQGSLTLSGLSLSVMGSTDDDRIAEAVPGEIRGVSTSDCLTVVNVESTGRVQAEAKRLAEAEARLAAEEEAKRKAEEEARIAAEADARRKAAEDEARRKAEEEARAKAAAEERRAAARTEAARCEQLLSDAAGAGVINFQRASADLDGRSKPTLDRLAKIMNDCPSFRVSIEGHTDSEGIPERNNPLSERRAQAVLTYLSEAGVDASRLSAVGYGAERPIADNATAEGRAKNRRIEFKVIAE